MTQASSLPPSRRSVLRRVATASTVGTTIEYYDFYIYGTAAALVFPAVFFPALGAAAGTVASFATLAVAFVARPLGAILFGHLGDRIGRKRTLVSTLLLMGTATFLVGVLPGASAIGVAAPIILVALRILQGLAVGGEWAGAALLTAEYAPTHKRGLYGIFPQLGPPLGLALSTATFLAVNILLDETSDAFLAWGWRIPFIVSALLVLVGLYVRLKVDETPVFARQSDARNKETTSPFVALFRDQFRELAIVTVALASLFAYFYIGSAYLTSYATTEMGLSRTTVLSLGIVASGFFVLATVLAGIYSDRIGRRKVVMASCIITIPFSLVMFPILDSNTGFAYFVVVSVMLAVVGMAAGPVGAMLPEMFDTKYRYTGAGMGWALGAVLGGASTPLIATQLTEAGESGKIGWMLAGFGVLSLLATLILPETKRRELEQIDMGSQENSVGQAVSDTLSP
ncbi:MFS transporter [Rhodococcus indonesiensis]